nr:unnamed protein product [Digitaria exilis]
MGDARSEVPLAVLHERPASTAASPAPAPPPATSGSDAGQQEHGQSGYARGALRFDLDPGHRSPACSSAGQSNAR